MFSILITHFYGNLSIVEPHIYPNSNPFSHVSGVEIVSLNSVEIQRMNLIKVCHILLILLSYMHISRDHKYYWHLIGTK